MLLPHNTQRFAEHSHGDADAGLDPELPVQPLKLSPQRVIRNTELRDNRPVLLLIHDAADDLESATCRLTKAQLRRRSHAAPNRASPPNEVGHPAEIWAYLANPLTIALLSLPPYALMSRHP